MRLLLALLSFCVLMESICGLSCFCPEDGSACQARKLSSVECPFGVIVDRCKCCQVCAKGPGDTCGGRWNYRGECGSGYACVPRAGDEEKWGFKGKCKTEDRQHNTKQYVPDGDISVELIY